MKDRSIFYRLFVGATILKIPFFESNRCLKKIRTHSLPLTYDKLGAHHWAGGRISSWVDGLIYAQEHGIKLDVDNAAARDLIAVQGSRITLPEHIRLLSEAGCRDVFGAPFDSLQKISPNHPPRTPESCTPANAYARGDRVCGILSISVGLVFLALFVPVALRSHTDILGYLFLFSLALGMGISLVGTGYKLLAAKISFDSDGIVYQCPFTRKGTRWDEIEKIALRHVSFSFTTHLEIKTMKGTHLLLPCADSRLLQTVIRRDIDAKIREKMANRAILGITERIPSAATEPKAEIP
jgi:hypothetical protein